MDPVTIALALTFFGAIVVAVTVVTIMKIVDWFRSRGRIKTEHAQSLAFTLAVRIKDKKYVEVNGVFDGKPTNTQIIQGFYDPVEDKIVDARAMASDKPPADNDIARLHDEGDGLVIYN